MQLKKEEIEENDAYTFESNWKIFGIGTVTLILFLAIAIAVMFAMESVGLISLA